MSAPEMAEGLVLRFRDLVTGKGKTIREHQEIVKGKGRVFWGWWNKLGEQPPIEAFTSLNEKATRTGLELYLFDSGQELVHKARCVGIHWAAPGAASIPSPDIASTPAYYKDQAYPAWFEFTGIESLPKEPWPLSESTYVRIDDLFASGVSKFIQFYGKRIASAQELAQQNRTVWFFRRSRPGEVGKELLPTKASPPEPFLRRIIDSPSANLLWISDTHFSVDAHHAFPADSKVNPTLGRAIEHALKDREVQGLAGVMHTGDLTWKAASSEFKETTRFLSWLRTIGPFDDNDPFSLCPGNHDLAFSTDSSRKDSQVTIAEEEATAAFRAFYSDFFGSEPNGFLSCGRRYLLARAIPVEVISLNSSLLQQRPKSFQGQWVCRRGSVEGCCGSNGMGWAVRT